jgi:hypothetical protein
VRELGVRKKDQKILFTAMKKESFYLKEKPRRIGRRKNQGNEKSFSSFFILSST